MDALDPGNESSLIVVDPEPQCAMPPEPRVGHAAARRRDAPAVAADVEVDCLTEGGERTAPPTRSPTVPRSSVAKPALPIAK